MPCPECGSTDHAALRNGPHALRQPVYRYGQTWRVHHCQNCGKMFMSVQKPMTMQDAAVWMEHLDNSTWMMPTDGSKTEQESEA